MRGHDCRDMIPVSLSAGAEPGARPMTGATGTAGIEGIVIMGPSERN
jgi:hypothetical protein